MKIISFTVVKDEEDIIESFIRYNMNILDKMIISENLSNDRTLEILYKLKDEGYDIDILLDRNKTFNQYERRNELLQYTINKYHPDYIFPLDADEFIATNKKCNPRSIIEKLDDDKMYLYKMENFVLTGESNEDLFIPSRLTKIRKVSKDYDYFYKCIIPKKIYLYSGGIDLASGAHYLVYKDGKKVREKYLQDLYLAHYPIRSVEQYTNKAINLALNGLRFHSRESGASHHKYYILDKILKDGKLNEKTLYEFSKYYDVVDTKTDKIYNKDLIKGLKDNKLDYSFCNKIKIKYAKKEDCDSFILKNTLNVSKSIIDGMREDIDNLNKKIEDIYTINNENNIKINKEISRLNGELNIQKKTLNDIYNSKGYRLLNKFYKLKDKLRKNK